MKKKSRILTMIGAAAAVVGLIGCSQSATSTEGGGEDEQIEVTLATLFAQGGWESDALDTYAERVTEASDGRITFDVHYAESLVKGPEIPGALQDGVADLAVVYPVYTPADFPISNWIAKLGFISEESHMEGYLATAGAQNDWAMNESLIQDEFQAQGSTVLANMLNVPAFDLLCRDEAPTSLEDLKGLRVRVGGEAWAAEATELGMEPVQLTGAEMYEGFQRGVVDCVLLHPGANIDSGMWEIGKHHIAARFSGWNQYYLTVSNLFWDDLPDWAKDIFQEEATYWMEQVATNYSGKAQTFFTEGKSEYGVEFLQPDADFSGALEEYHADLLNGRLADEAPDVLSKEDAQGLIDRRLEAQDKWEGIVSDANLGLGTDKTWSDWVATHPDPVDLTEWRALLDSDA